MATDKGNGQDSSWPLPKFAFEVDFGHAPGKTMFTEVSGLDIETQVLEYRAANRKVFSTVKMPGIAKYGNVTLKKGIFKNDDFFQDWQKQVQTNSLSRSAIVIRLLDETGKPVITWTLLNARPAKITGTDLKGDGNEVAIESIELIHEGVQVTNS